MKWRIAGMREEFVEGFVRWLKNNNVRFSAVFAIDGIWCVMYMPIGREQEAMCEEYIEYRCDNDLM